MAKSRRPAVPRPLKTPSSRRLSPAEWIEAEELYRHGKTQRELAGKFGISVESVSRHMVARAIKGGEKAEIVRRELVVAIERKTREFAEAKASRQIDAKDMLYKMNNALLATFAREFRDAQVKSANLASLSGSAKALKEALLAMKIGREEVYALLEIDPTAKSGLLPILEMHEMSEQDEANLRNRIAEGDDDEEEDAREAIAEIAALVEATPAT